MIGKYIYFFVRFQVFADDEMPTTVCERCRALMSYCYQFKQMCRRADTLLKQVPLTGVWPNKLEHPKYPIRQAMVCSYFFSTTLINIKPWIPTKRLFFFDFDH